MPTMTGIEAFLEVLAGAGVRTIFGNPGTTELPLNDALARDGRFTYIFGLHEVPVVGMADGYAMASGNLGVANVHAACGLGYRRSPSGDAARHRDAEVVCDVGSVGNGVRSATCTGSWDSCA